MSNVAIAAPDPTKARDFSRFSCRRFDTAGTVRVAVAGELDMATVPELDLTLRHAQADARVVALDLRELEFIDSSGVHLLLAAGRRAREAVAGCPASGAPRRSTDCSRCSASIANSSSSTSRDAVAATATIEHAR